mmetsp:Transcript_51853/g.135298  ORF Transcript_51853/g.135298 Transcript_51853/m.135298 type:complete len:187 (+) Transcript_51853:1396-1956(+)
MLRPESDVRVRRRPWKLQCLRSVQFVTVEGLHGRYDIQIYLLLIRAGFPERHHRFLSCLTDASGSASSRVCGHGIFLCQADSKARYPWVIDPLAWYQFSESIRGEFHTKVPQETVVEIVPSDSVETTQGSPVEDDLKFVDGQTGEMLADRDPDTGERFPNILALREAKLRDWLRVSQAIEWLKLRW